MIQVAALMPIRNFGDAKNRLSGVLDQKERSLLFSAMVEDVLATLQGCAKVDSIVVVTNDLEAGALAQDYGATVIPEPERPGLIRAVSEAARQLTEAGVEVMLFLPGDVPLVGIEELEVVLEGFGQSEKPELVIVPAKDMGGTNCMAISPPSAIDFKFGEDSYKKHLDSARSMEIEPQTLRLPGIGLDIDTPADLMQLLDIYEKEMGGGSEYYTLRYLVSSGIAERLAMVSKELD
ncbi:MAG: 2-phospho-L-lactate guanylyltransferase [Gammaproteobacteria bacterium]|nr:2-phospho-L-lactate guanylyltransferase [Gammaproteobacteria bacterium]|tara:strand:- start:245 stop:949 length:705 start_codon:yes stop_codon:yes gene_type:complete